MTNLVFIDTETTGLVAERHPIWEIALIFGEHEVTYQFPVDLSTADPMALSMNGYYGRADAITAHARSLWDDSSTWSVVGVKDALRSVARITAGATLVGSNPAFDAQRLDILMRKHGVGPAWHYRLVDVNALAMGHLHAEVKGLSDAYPKLTGKEIPKGQHEALVDARMAKEVYEAVMAYPSASGGLASVVRANFDTWLRPEDALEDLGLPA